MAGKPGCKSQKGTDLERKFREDFLETMDGRVREVRTLQDRLRALTNDLGGVTHLSYQQQSLSKRAIHIERHIEKLETTLAHGGTVDLHIYFAAITTLSSLFAKLGLGRRARPIKSLGEYISATKEGDRSPSASQQSTNQEE